MQIAMTIKGLMVDPVTNMPIIILRDEAGGRVLPIWVGIFEANAIALQIENISTPRPMTHDLLRNVIQDLNASVQKIVVCDLQENTFYALIYLALDGGTVANNNLGDYKLPSIKDIPQLKTVLVKTTGGVGPLDSKPIGEFANNGPPAAIANAIADAVGVRVFDLPVKAENVYQALKERGLINHKERKIHKR